MLAQTDRFALHFEIPAVLHSFFVERAIRGEVTGTIAAAALRELFAGRLQLIEEALEPTADPRERRRALFLQFLEKALVLGPGCLDAHGSILRAVNGVYGLPHTPKI